MINYGLKNRVALITGANNPQGIGATTAFAFVREGAKVVLYIRKCEDPMIKARPTETGLTDITKLMRGMLMLLRTDSKK